MREQQSAATSVEQAAALRCVAGGASLMQLLRPLLLRLLPVLLQLVPRHLDCTMFVLIGTETPRLHPHFFDWYRDTSIVPLLLWLVPRYLDCTIIVLIGAETPRLYHVCHPNVWVPRHLDCTTIALIAPSFACCSRRHAIQKISRVITLCSNSSVSKHSYSRNSRLNKLCSKHTLES